MIIGQQTCVDLSLSKRVTDAQGDAVQLQHTMSRQNAERIDQFMISVVSIGRQQSIRRDNIASGSLCKTLPRTRHKNLFVIHRVHNHGATGRSGAECRGTASQRR